VLGAFHLGAKVGLAKLELTADEAVALIAGIDGAACFYKSMQARKDRSGRLWQDVYLTPAPSTDQMVYIEFSPVIYAAPRSGISPKSPQIVISFKPLDTKDK